MHNADDKSKTKTPKPPEPPKPRIVTEAEAADWTTKLRMHGGKPVAWFSNILVALRHAPEWQNCFEFNQFSHKVYLSSDPPWGDGHRDWGDNDDRLATEWMQNFGMNVPIKLVGQAVQTVAQERTYNPLLQYLNDLHWDGKLRIHRWLVDYMSVVDSLYARQVGKCWLISAVARAYEPGCKADTCLILEGKQGSKKSTSLRTLASQPFFNDYMGENLASKDAMISCIGNWIIEMSELESLRGTEIGAIKTFLSKREDQFRPPYGHHNIRVPRQCIFAGTTNGDDYLRDETGARRFWPVRTDYIDIDALERDRDQLWAEAITCYGNHEPWWLDVSMERLARAEQAERFNEDPWQAPIAKWVQGRPDVSLGEVLAECFYKRNDEWNRTDEMRVSRSLKALGWQRYKSGSGSNRGSYREYRYRPADD